MKKYRIIKANEVIDIGDTNPMLTGVEITGDDDMQVSDGYHTMDELYDHRTCLWITLCRLWENSYGQAQWKESEGRKFFTWRSKFHADGSSYDGWFILGILTKDGLQLSYHLPNSKWEETAFAETLDKAPEWDGHTPQDVLERLKKL